MRTIRGLLVVVVMMVGFAGPAGAMAQLRVQGTFVAGVDFTSLTLRDGPAGGCVLTVGGEIVFSGSEPAVVGSAVGTTTALIAASCAEVATSPPGTDADVFSFRGRFDGSVNGMRTSGPLVYAGVTQPGGRITAVITLRGNVSAVLRADARVAVGGSYSGFATT